MSPALGSVSVRETNGFRMRSVYLTTVSLVLYGFSIAYLIAPGTFDSTHVIEAVQTLPESVKYAGKFILAAPFSYHAINGLRHLAWDLNKCACDFNGRHLATSTSPTPSSSTSSRVGRTTPARRAR